MESGLYSKYWLLFETWNCFMVRPRGGASPVLNLRRQYSSSNHDPHYYLPGAEQSMVMDSSRTTATRQHANRAPAQNDRNIYRN